MRSPCIVWFVGYMNAYTSGQQLRLFRKVRLVLEDVLSTAQAVNVSATNRAAACNLLCAIVERCQASTFEKISALIWLNDIWMRLFNVYLDRSDSAKAKPMRQLLVVLTNTLLQCPRKVLKQTTRNDALFKLFDILFRESDYSRVKPASQALAYFITKRLFSVDDMLDLFDERCPEEAGDVVNGGDHRDHAQYFLDGLFNWVLHNDVAPATGNLISVFLTQAREQRAERLSRAKSTTGLPSWVKPFETSIRRAPHMIQNFKNYVLPDIFRLSLADYVLCLEHWHLDAQIRLKAANAVPNSDRKTFSDAGIESILLFAALQTGKEIGMVKEVGKFGLSALHRSSAKPRCIMEDHRFNQTITTDEEAVCIPDIHLGRLLAHGSSLVRLAALSLLVSSAATTRPCTSSTLKCLERHLPHLLADTDASFRSEVLGLLQQLIDRLRAATANLAKALSREQKTQGAANRQNTPANLESPVHMDKLRVTLSVHQSFISWLITYLRTELRPSASYQKHISALRALTMLLKSGLDPTVSRVYYSRQAQGQIRWPFHLKILNTQLVRAILDLVMDPFDDVRYAAAFILRICNQENASEGTNAHEPLQGLPLEASLAAETSINVAADLVPFIQRAETTMLRSGRADHADGVARAYRLLFEQTRPVYHKGQSTLSGSITWWGTKFMIVEHLVAQLEEIITVVRRSFSAAVARLPMHGILASIR